MENQDDGLHVGKVVRTSHYRAEMSQTDINVLYSVMVLRISKGYLAEETSFLMGMGSDLIGRFEKLARKRVTIGMLDDVLSALGKKSLSGFILFGSGLKKGNFDCHMVRTRRTKIIEHSLFLKDANGDERLAFKLFEINPHHMSLLYCEEQQMKDVRDILETELIDNWSDPKTPIEIYQHCCMLTDHDIMPRNVMKVLDEMVSRRSYPKLVVNRSNEKRKITYDRING